MAKGTAAGETSRSRFLRLLRNDILKLDLADLDFGIYRILNYRRAEIEEFLSDRLPKLMEEVLEHEGETRLEQLRADLAALQNELEKSASGLGLKEAFPDGQLHETLRTVPRGEQYLHLENEMSAIEATAGFSSTEEERLYNHLFTFFGRYYADGDFLPLPRRGRDAKYMAPFSGEDVHFHWKSKGSHYVKTAEELRSYAFRAGPVRVEFQLAEATEESDNTKGTTRYFVPLLERLESSEKSLRLPFAFRPLTVEENKKYEKGEKGQDGASAQERLVEDKLKALRPKLSKGTDVDALERHLKRYVRKNRTDYFVHPNLGRFLKAELDHYLITEFLDADGFSTPRSLVDQFLKFRGLRGMGYQIIEFLDQIESFQASLFEKRKFVLETHYLIAGRLVPEELHPTVLSNSGQVAHWRNLLGEEDVSDLGNHPTLMVNTQFFTKEERSELIAALPNLDEMTDAVLVHGENYGALRTLEASLTHRVDLAYIDPPYNTGNDGFLYKDEFSRHSTWLSMMAERLSLVHGFLSQEGVFVSHIDENEMERLQSALEGIFGPDNALGTIVWDKRNPKGDPLGVAAQHEYLLLWARNRQHLKSLSDFLTRRKKNALVILAKAASLVKEGSAQGLTLDQINDMYRNWIKKQEFSGGERAYDRIDENQRVYRPVSMAWPNRSKAPDEYFIPLIHPVTGQPCPVPERGWRNPPQTMAKLLERSEILFGKDHSTIPNRKYFLDDNLTENLPSLLYYGSSDDALIENLGLAYGDPSLKPLAVSSQIVEAASGEHGLVIDFFAGSGTTGHACIALNREIGGNRRFVLVEQGAYFDSALLGRIERVAYAPTWKDGKPTAPNEESDWVERSPRLMKVLKIESYEDSLQSLELPIEREARIAGQSALLEEEFLLRYLLPMETENSEVLLSTQALAEPSQYRLRTHTPNGVEQAPVDLVETFNLLMGFQVQRIYGLEDEDRIYQIVEAQAKDSPVLIVWRSIEELDPKRERKFLGERIELDRFHKIYVNADSALPGAESLDAEFKRRMMERDHSLR